MPAPKSHSEARAQNRWSWSAKDEIGRERTHEETDREYHEHGMDRKWQRCLISAVIRMHHLDPPSKIWLMITVRRAASAASENY